MVLTKMKFKIMNIGTIQRQSLISITWQIMLTLIGFVSTIYFVRFAGTKTLGAYFLILTYYSIINMVSDGGFGGAAIKRISEGEEPNEYLTAFFTVRFLFTVISLIILIIFRNYFANLNDSGTFVWLLFLLMLNGTVGFIGLGNAGSGKIGIHSTCSFIGEVSRIVIQIIAIFLGFGIAGLIGGMIASLIISSILELKFFDLRFVKFKWVHFKNLANFSFWSFLASSGVLLYTNTDTILIGHFLGSADVAIYRVIVQFSMVGLLVSSSLNATLWPKISRWGKTKDLKSIEDSLSRAISFSLLLAVPILIGGIILGDKLLNFFYGGEFSKGYGILIVMLMVQVVSIFQIFYLSYLGALDRQKDAFKVTIIAAILNIILNFILIPIIGIIGAAIATMMTMILNALLAYLLLSKLIHIRLEKDSLYNIFKASFMMLIFILIYRLSLNIIIYPLNIIMVPVLIGGIIFIFMILKIDNSISAEIKNILVNIF